MKNYITCVLNKQFYFSHFLLFNLIFRESLSRIIPLRFVMNIIFCLFFLTIIISNSYIILHFIPYAFIFLGVCELLSELFEELFSRNRVLARKEKWDDILMCIVHSRIRMGNRVYEPLKLSIYYRVYEI